MGLLERMAVRLSQSNVVQETDRLHEQTSTQVLELLVGLDYATLDHLYNSVMVGTSYEQETMGLVKSFNAKENSCQQNYLICKF